MADIERDDEQLEVFGIPVFITKQLDPGTIVVFTMIYEPTEDRADRWRISAVKVVGIDWEVVTNGCYEA
jgi:hypothetical protein